MSVHVVIRSRDAERHASVLCRRSVPDQDRDVPVLWANQAGIEALKAFLPLCPHCVRRFRPPRRTPRIVK